MSSITRVHLRTSRAWRCWASHEIQAPRTTPSKPISAVINQRWSLRFSNTRWCRLIAVSTSVDISSDERGSREMRFFLSSSRASNSAREIELAKSTLNSFWCCRRQTSEARSRLESRRKTQDDPPGPSANDLLWWRHRRSDPPIP